MSFAIFTGKSAIITKQLTPVFISLTAKSVAAEQIKFHRHQHRRDQHFAKLDFLLTPPRGIKTLY